MGGGWGGGKGSPSTHWALGLEPGLSWCQGERVGLGLRVRLCQQEQLLCCEALPGELGRSPDEPSHWTLGKCFCIRVGWGHPTGCSWGRLWWLWGLEKPFSLSGCWCGCAHRKWHLRCQLGDRLHIELDAVPTVDPGTVLEETRCPYKAMVETHRRDGEQWFQAQVRTQLRSGERPGFCSGSVS